MIHVVNLSNRHLYERQIGQLFDGRPRSTRGRRGPEDSWVFDDAGSGDLADGRAAYLMAIDEDGLLQGAVRARPTDGPSVIFDDHPNLIAPGHTDLRGALTWEAAPVFTTAAFRRSRLPGRRGLFGLALASREVALDAGARRMVGRIDPRMFDRLTSSGAVETRILGLPAQYGCGVMVAVSVDVSASNNVRTQEGLAEPVRISYQIDEEDIASFGSILAVERMVEAARWGWHEGATLPLTSRAEAMAEAKALFAVHDVAIGVLQD